MAARLEEFGEWVKKSLSIKSGKTNYMMVRDFMDWIKSSINLYDVSIEHHMSEDCFIIRNIKTNNRYKITRFELENSSTPKIEVIKGIATVLCISPEEVVQRMQLAEEDQAAESWQSIFGKGYHMITTDEIAVGTVTANPNRGVTSAIYAPGSYPIWVGGDGSGFGGAGGAIGAPYTGMSYPKGVVGANYDQNGNPMPHDLTAELEAEEDKAVQQIHKDLIRNRLFTEAERQELTDAKNKIAHMFRENRLAEEMAIPFKFNKMVIAGGCFASLLNQEPINDIDVFLLDDEYNRDLAQGMAKSYEVDQPVMIQTSGSSANTISGYISLSPKKNNNHVRIGDTNYMDNDKIERTIFFKHSRMQYITTKYKTREELINHFDFKHCCVSYDIAADKLYITREVYDLIKSKKLVQNSKRIPANWRFDKFRERGWKHEPLDVMFL